MTSRAVIVIIGVLSLTASACADDDAADTGDDGSSVVIATTTSTAASTPPSDTEGTVAPTASAPPAGSDAPPAASAPATDAPEPDARRARARRQGRRRALATRRSSSSTVTEVDAPVDLAWRGGDPTLYVVGQGGIITAVDAASGAGRPVLDITDLTDAAGERGLLGLDFHPAGDRAYVNYIDGNGDTVIAEFTVGADGTFDRDSERVLLIVDQPYANHNGGDLAFGPDGMLYIGLGDGGSGGDPERRALDLGTLLGKISRIDPDPVGRPAVHRAARQPVRRHRRGAR